MVRLHHNGNRVCELSVETGNASNTLRPIITAFELIAIDSAS